MFRLTVLILLLSSVHATAATYRVPQDLPTIQAALDSVGNSDSILVSPGTYYENLVWPARWYVKVIGSGKDCTFINGSGQNRVIHIDHDDLIGADERTVIWGFTLEDGYTDDKGGGICCINAGPTLSNLRIRNCVASSEGGGIYIEDAEAILDSLEISNNSAGWMGGGICFRCDDGQETWLQNTLFYENFSNGPTAIAIRTQGYFRIYHCTMAYNYSNAPAVWIDDDAIVELNNVILWGNTNSQLSVCGEAYVGECDIQGGEEGVSVCADGILHWGYWLGHFNIDEDPLFCNPDSADYQLEEDSPCFYSPWPSIYDYMGYTLLNCGGVNPVENQPEIPARFDFCRAYPNPFNPSTTLEFTLTLPTEVSVLIYNIRGQLVDKMHQSFPQPGKHTLVWIPQNLPSGLYFATVCADHLNETVKLIYLP